MARQIPDLPLITANEARDDDVLLIRDVSSQTDKKITIDNLLSWILGNLPDEFVTSEMLVSSVNGNKIDIEKNEDLYFQKGKTYTWKNDGNIEADMANSFNAVGYITSSKGQMILNIPMPKMFPKNCSVQVTVCKGNIRTGSAYSNGGGYTNGGYNLGTIAEACPKGSTLIVRITGSFTAYQNNMAIAGDILSLTMKVS